MKSVNDRVLVVVKKALKVVTFIIDGQKKMSIDTFGKAKTSSYLQFEALRLPNL